jgi:outer membrane scaffolding protein for murein synthesis (MipA/OmpV family)
MGMGRGFAMTFRVCLRLLAAACFGCTAFCANLASAQTPEPLAYWQNTAGIVLIPLGGPIPDWRVNVDMGATAFPLYEGSNRYQFLPAPGFDIRYKDIAFISAGDGIGVNLLRGESYRAGVAISYDIGRSQHAAYRLNGTGSISPSPEVKLFAEGFILPFVFSANIRKQLAGTDGVIGDLGVYMPVVGNETMVVFVGPGVTVANRTYMQKYFGIGTTQEFPRSQFGPYAAGAGFKNANFGVSAIYNLTKQWYINADAGYERLLGSAADSPIVQARNQLDAVLQVGYQF